MGEVKEKATFFFFLNNNNCEKRAVHADSINEQSVTILILGSKMRSIVLCVARRRTHIEKEIFQPCHMYLATFGKQPGLFWFGLGRVLMSF